MDSAVERSCWNHSSRSDRCSYRTRSCSFREASKSRGIATRSRPRASGDGDGQELRRRPLRPGVDTDGGDRRRRHSRAGSESVGRDPALQVTLSRRQHIMVNAGARIPLTDRSERRTQIVTYLLWTGSMEGCSMAGGSAAAIVAGVLLWGLRRARRSAGPVSPPNPHGGAQPGPHFQTAENCLACHNGLTAPSGEDVSIGSAWRGSIMANSSRDPYWQASVRRENSIDRACGSDRKRVLRLPHADGPNAGASTQAGTAEIFAHLPIGRPALTRIASPPMACHVQCAIRSTAKGWARRKASPEDTSSCRRLLRGTDVRTI